MKTCPYCAEEIKDAAIVCRYCGRDLPIEGEVKAPAIKKPSLLVKKRKTSAWLQGAKVSLIFTALAFVFTFVKYKNAPAELVGNILFGLPVTFAVWWLLASGGIALWRKGIRAFFGFAGGVILILAIVILFQGGLVVQPPASKSDIVPTAKPTQRAFVIQTTTPFYEGNYASCYSWEVFNNMPDGSRMNFVCAKGIVVDVKENAGDCEYRFSNNIQALYGLETNCSEKYPKIKVGDCVVFDGFLHVNETQTRSEHYFTRYIQVAHWQLDSACSE